MPQSDDLVLSPHSAATSGIGATNLGIPDFGAGEPGLTGSGAGTTMTLPHGFATPGLTSLPLAQYNLSLNADQQHALVI